MKVWLNDSSQGPKIDRTALRRDTGTILSALGFRDAELSVTLTSDDAIAQIAGDFGRERRPTDVQASAEEDPELLEILRAMGYLGDGDEGDASEPPTEDADPSEQDG